MSQMKKFCQKYNMSNKDVLLKDETKQIQKNLFRHLIFSDKKKFVYCFLPKVSQNDFVHICWFLVSTPNNNIIYVHIFPPAIQAIQLLELELKLLITA